MPRRDRLPHVSVSPVGMVPDSEECGGQGEGRVRLRDGQEEGSETTATPFGLRRQSCSWSVSDLKSECEDYGENNPFLRARFDGLYERYGWLLH